MLHKILLVATVVGVASPLISQDLTASAQVHGLTLEAYNPGATEVVLTNNRGVVSLPSALSFQGNSSVVFWEEISNAITYTLDSSSSSMEDTGTGFQRYEIRPANGSPLPWYSGSFSGNINGWDSNGNPISVPGPFAINVFAGQCSCVLSKGSVQNFDPGTSGFLYSTIPNSPSGPFPNGFTTISPVSLSNQPVQPLPIIQSSPSIQTLPTIQSSPSVQPTLNPQSFSTPTPTTQPAHPAAQTLATNGAAPGQRAFRPNGVHTRIVPEWSPGLYQ